MLASEPGRKHGRGDRERMHPNTIANWEKRLRPGEKSYIPQINTLKRVAEAFGFPPDSAEYRALFVTRHESELARRSAGKPKRAMRKPAPPADNPAFVIAGRESHLRRLEDLARIAISGQPRVALLHAEPGAGKSALVTELGRRLAAGDATAPLIVVGACRDDGQADGLLPARDMLSTLLGVRDDSRALPPGGIGPEAETLPAFIDLALDAGLLPGHWPLMPGALDRLEKAPGLGDSQRARLAAAIGQTKGHPAPDDTGQGAAWAEAVVLRARSLPAGLILVVEDLHWASSAFASALTALLDRMQQDDRLPLLLVLTWRPEDLQRARPGGTHSAESLLAAAAARFPDGDIDLQTAVGGAGGRAFVQAALARLMGATSVPPSFAATLTARTNGLPLFVMGMLRLFEERGLLENGRPVGPADIDWSELPEELESLFQERLERLDLPTRDLLALASVQGEQFVADPIFVALGLDRDLGVERLYRDLGHRWGMVTYVETRPAPVGPPGTAGGGTEQVWAFAHALLRDYVLRHLTPFERRRAHLRIADAMLAMYGDGAHSRCERIAWHLEQAGDFTRASVAWVRAGDQAVAESDPLRAMSLFARVEETGAAMRNPPMLVQASLGLANCARALGDGEAADRFAEQGVRQARAIDDPQALANALQMLSTIRFDQGRHLDGIAALREAEPILMRTGDPVERCRIGCLLAFNLIALGHYDEAMMHASRAVALAEAVGTDRVGVTALVARANVHVELGQYETALSWYRQGLDRAVEQGHATAEALCDVNIGLCHVERGETKPALEALARVHELGRELPILGFVAAAHFDEAILAESRGQLAEAARAFTRSLDLRVEIGQHALQIDSLAGLLRVAVRDGDVPAAETLLGETEARLRDGGLIGSEHHGRLLLAVIQGNRLLGREGRAAEVAREAVAFLRQRLAHIGDDRDRRSYLDEVPAHHRLLAEIESILGPVRRLLLDERAE